MLPVRGIVVLGRQVVRIRLASVLVFVAAETSAPEGDREQEKAQRDRRQDERERLEHLEDPGGLRAHGEVDDRGVLVPGRIVGRHPDGWFPSDPPPGCGPGPAAGTPPAPPQSNPPPRRRRQTAPSRPL